MRPFSISFGNVYILLVVDYVSKWNEAISTKSNETRVVVKFLKQNIFPIYGMPCVTLVTRVPILTTDHWIHY